MSSDSKHTEWILETIDHLRRRKARPDLQRICHVVRRNFGLQAADTEAKLEKLVDAEIVIKVEYKGSTSYRNAAKWRKSMLGCAVQNSKKVSTKIIEAILDITKVKLNGDSSKNENNNYTANCKTDEADTKRAVKSSETPNKVEAPCDNNNTPENEPKTGASFKDINSWLQKHYEGCKHLKSPMMVVLKREIDAGRIRKLDDGTFDLTESQKSSVIKNEAIVIVDNFPPRNDTTASNNNMTSSVVSGVPNLSGKDNSTSGHRPSGVKLGLHPPGHQPARRGRPPKWKHSMTSSTHHQSTSNILKPPKLKRSASAITGGESGASIAAKVLKKERQHDESDICDVCRLTTPSGSKGQPEILLHCSDCAVKAHPSCLKYNSTLASRARKGPWQCTDCKICCVCHDSGQPDQMLFCDGCDKGYHMSCHQPSVLKKPSGLWECYECRLENSTHQRSEFFAMHNQRNSEVQDSAPPTPAESPVPSSSPQSRSNFPDASEWTVSDVVQYFASAGFSKEAQIFKEQEIDGIAVLLLRRSDVLKGLELKLGPALKINRIIEGLQTARHQVT